MVKLCKDSGGNETGGILVGHYTSNRNCAIVKAIGAQPSDSIASHSSFYRGVKGVARWLSTLWEHAQRNYYLGEWHFHPFSSSEPSPVDISQMIAIANDNSYHCPEPLLIIAGGDPSKRLELTGLVLKRSGESINLTRV